MQSDVTSFASLAPAYPELLLATGAVVVLLIALFWKGISPTVVAIVSIALLVAVLAVLLLQPATGVLFNGVFIVDGFARYMKALVLGGAAATLLISLSNSKEHGIDTVSYTHLTLPTIYSV